MTLPTLIITACFLIFAVTVVLFGGPSVGKAKSRRLSTVKDRHAASTEAAVAAQMRKTIQAASGRDSKLSSLMPRRAEMEKRLLRKIGRAPDSTPVTNAPPLCRLQIAKKT